ncbi:MAG: dihydrolipoamide acetyltransferase family protein, partial [Bacteroidota bacterium]
VRNIAAQENISLEELETLTGTGANGRVTKHDILNYLKSRNKTNVTPANPQQQETVAIAPANTNTATQAAQFPVFKPDAAPNQQVSTIVKNNAQVELIEMDRMRRLIADHMVRSKQTSPHVSSFVEADVTNIVQWRNRAKKEFQSKYGEKLTYTPIFVEAVAKAIRDFPMVNVSVEGTTIIKKNQVHIGMATALPSGNLIVPVIKNADQKNLVGLAKSVNDLVARARTNKLQATEIQDGTFTITNIGTFGNVLGTPIINQPQVAILAVGAIQKKPAVVETPEGDFIGIRHLMYLSLSYDHRVVDGFLGGSFLRKIADYLEDFDPTRGV